MSSHEVSIPSRYTGVEVAAGVAVAFSGAILSRPMREAIFHETEGEHTLNTEHELQHDISVTQEAGKVFTNQPSDLKSKVDTILSARIAQDKTAITTLRARHPIYAGGEQAEAVFLGLGGTIVITVLAMRLAFSAHKFINQQRQQIRSTNPYAGWL